MGSRFQVRRVRPPTARPHSVRDDTVWNRAYRTVSDWSTSLVRPGLKLFVLLFSKSDSMRATEPHTADGGSSSDDERAAAVTRYAWSGHDLGEVVGTAFHVPGFDSRRAAPFSLLVPSSSRPLVLSSSRPLVSMELLITRGRSLSHAGSLLPTRRQRTSNSLWKTRRSSRLISPLRTVVSLIESLNIVSDGFSGSWGRRASSMRTG